MAQDLPQVTQQIANSGIQNPQAGGRDSRAQNCLPCLFQGGSSAKGTVLQGRSDADLVVFLSCFSQFNEQGRMRAEIISEIRTQLEACQKEQQFEVKFEISKWKNPRVLSFSLTSKTMLDHSVDFDVLPAFDALGERASARS